jgi:hypothetical protein
MHEHEPYFIIQWQTKECYIGQRWTTDVYEATAIVHEQFGKQHQSLQVFLVSRDDDIMELNPYFDAIGR